MAAYNYTSLTIVDLPDESKIPEELPFVVDTTSLAHRLGIRGRTLMHMIINRESLYTVHKIPKKSGGLRTIHAPNERLKFVQTQVLNKFLAPLTYPDHVAAYVKGKTTRDSAEVHAGKPILIVIDLKDFFPSTRRSWIRHMLQEQFGYSHSVASLLSDLMTVPMDFPYGKRYVVPQGAPTSGAICNWVAHERIDKAILDICKKYNMAYTRYADDLAFSNAERLDKKVTNAFLREVMSAIKKGGYTVNKKKLRVVRSGRQQRLLGMTINEKPNIMRLQYRKMRARIHQCSLKGFDAVATDMAVASGARLKSQIEGQLSYWHMINPEKAAKLRIQLEAACNNKP